MLTSLTESSSERQRALTGRPSFSGQLVAGSPIATDAVSASFKFACWRLLCLTGGCTFCCVRRVNTCRIRGICCRVYHGTPATSGKYFTLKQRDFTICHSSQISPALADVATGNSIRCAKVGQLIHFNDVEAAGIIVERFGSLWGERALIVRLTGFPQSWFQKRSEPHLIGWIVLGQTPREDVTGSFYHVTHPVIACIALNFAMSRECQLGLAGGQMLPTKNTKISRQDGKERGWISFDLDYSKTKIRLQYQRSPETHLKFQGEKSHLCAEIRFAVSNKCKNRQGAIKYWLKK